MPLLSERPPRHPVTLPLPADLERGSGAAIRWRNAVRIHKQRRWPGLSDRRQWQRALAMAKGLSERDRHLENRVRRRGRRLLEQMEEPVKRMQALGRSEAKKMQRKAG